jgi:hypothetical protein
LILTWYVKGNLAVDTAILPRFKLEKAMVPTKVWMHSEDAPQVQPVIIDINDDGTSIFTYRPSMISTEHVSRLMGVAKIAKDSVITLDIDQTGLGQQPGKNLTVQLYLEETQIVDPPMNRE